MNISILTCLTLTELVDKISNLQKEVLEGPPIQGLTEELFKRPFKLHIAINVMTLLNDGDTDRAKQLLEDCVEKVIV